MSDLPYRLMDSERLTKILDRPLYEPYFGKRLEHEIFYKNKKVLVTGARGSIGSAIVKELEEIGARVIKTDVENMNVLNYPSVYRHVYSCHPDIIFHLAAAKHAPAGEEDPASTYRINTIGTENIINAMDSVGWFPKLILASTCKACNPETAYGASKLIAERMVLNAGGYVGRFYNVIETSGNVFEIWDNLPSEQPIQYTDCNRYFITIKEATDFLMTIPLLQSGRYTISPGLPRNMGDIAEALYPDRVLVKIPARRGDRTTEPRIAIQETIEDAGYPIDRIISQHD